MIDSRIVLDEVLAVVTEEATVPVGLHVAPAGASVVVVEHPPGSDRTGSLGCPDADLVLRVRLRAKVTNSKVAQACREASHVVNGVEAHLLARSTVIAGDGWEVVTRTHVADGGVDWEGNVANHTVDVDLFVIEGPDDDES